MDFATASVSAATGAALLVVASLVVLPSKSAAEVEVMVAEDRAPEVPDVAATVTNTKEDEEAIEIASDDYPPGLQDEFVEKDQGVDLLTPVATKPKHRTKWMILLMKGDVESVTQKEILAEQKPFPANASKRRWSLRSKRKLV